MTAQVAFTAYVDGAEMGRAVTARLEELCAQHDLQSRISVVDVAADPGLAEQHNIVGVPTVIREDPPPRRRVIGALEDTRRVAEALGLDVQAAGNGGSA